VVRYHSVHKVCSDISLPCLPATAPQHAVAAVTMHKRARGRVVWRVSMRRAVSRVSRLNIVAGNGRAIHPKGVLHARTAGRPSRRGDRRRQERRGHICGAAGALAARLSWGVVSPSPYRSCRAAQAGHSISIHVGSESTKADYRLADVPTALALLDQIVQG
jgi:hypothetical protein